MTSRPRIAITLGDPAGVGPEVILKALANPEIRSLADFVVVADRWILDHTAASVLNTTLDPAIVIRDLQLLPPSEPFAYGKLSATCGRASVEYVREATLMCLRGEADAMVTAPVNKEAVTLSGLPFSGHTEFIAELCGNSDSRMMLASERMRVVHVSTHIALRDACSLNVPRIVKTIELADDAVRMLGFAKPRLAVCGLNPHAGEHGLFGVEDEEIIGPAIETARNAGIDASGPHAPDTIFLSALKGNYDAIIAMYHDQGHIPMKLLDFESGVNVTLGIPIIRTSVDHGTAFDIAGKNIAGSRNMEVAIRLAVRFAGARQRSAVV